MPTATVTVRELKNKDTGLDISIPTHKDIPVLLGVTTEYHVMVVSRLHYFKSPKHKETDVVQFMISKKFTDFEHLHTHLTEQFPSTILPLLPKKQLRVSDTVAKERKSKLENFLRFLASTTKLSTCSRLLEFLGVNAIKAGRYRKDGEASDEREKEKDRQTEESSQPMSGAGETNLFGEGEEGEINMFEEGEVGDDENLFAVTMATGANRTATGVSAEVHLFEEQDLGGGLQEGEGDDLLNILPEARVSLGQPRSETTPVDLEDNSDLLLIEDLDKLLTVEISKKKQTAKDDNAAETESSNKKPGKLPKPDGKPMQKPRPKPRQKVVLDQKPKVSKKPIIARKPGTENTGTSVTKASEGEATPAGGDNSIPDIDSGDILKYIQENASAGNDDLDLFS